MTVRRLALVLSLLISAGRLTAQATSVTAPTDNYLFHLTNGWGAGSALGSLAERHTNAGDIELRVWGGYGLAGTAGVVLRRSAGQWRAWRVKVVGCTYSVPVAIGDTASPATASLFARRARETCGGSLDSTAAGQSVYTVDTLAISEMPSRDLEGVWRRAVGAGVRLLPPRVARKWTMLDGFTYVIELREGGVYRASVIEALDKPEVEADRQARLVYEAVQQGVPTSPRQRGP